MAVDWHDEPLMCRYCIPGTPNLFSLGARLFCDLTREGSPYCCNSVDLKTGSVLLEGADHVISLRQARAVSEESEDVVALKVEITTNPVHNELDIMRISDIVTKALQAEGA